MRLRSIVGIILIIASIAGIYFWETSLRDELLLEPVMVASRNISKGELVSCDDFKEINELPSNILSVAMSYSDVNSLSGLVAASDIYLNEQIVFSRFVTEESLIPKDTNVFVIPKSWIFLFNPELSAGDIVDIYLLPSKEFEGEYEIISINEDSIEIRCHLMDYFYLYDLIPIFEENQDNDVLLFVSKE